MDVIHPDSNCFLSQVARVRVEIYLGKLGDIQKAEIGIPSLYF